MSSKLLFKITILLCIAQIVSAQIPRTMRYQGLLTDGSGAPLPDGNYNITFRLFDVETGGTALWRESQLVLVLNGVFNTILGENNPLSLPFDKAYWLELQLGSDEALQPRISLVSVASSLSTVHADTAGIIVGRASGDLTGAFPNAQVAGIQGNPIVETAAQDGQVLKWRASPGIWQPETDTTEALWRQTGEDVYRGTGNVGIGLEYPSGRLHIVSRDSSSPARAFIAMDDSGDTVTRFIEINGRHVIRMRSFGNVVASISSSFTHGEIHARSLTLDGGGITAAGAVATTSNGTFSTITVSENSPPPSSSQSPSTGRVYRNSIPLAYGYIFANAFVDVDYGISSASHPDIGQYEITLDRAISGTPLVLATAVHATPEDIIIIYDPVASDDKVIRLNISDGDGNPRSATFAFVVFGTPK